MNGLLLSKGVCGSLGDSDGSVSLVSCNSQSLFLSLKERDEVVQFAVVGILESAAEVVVDAVLHLTSFAVDSDGRGTKVVQGNHGLVSVDFQTSVITKSGTAERE